MTPKKHRAKMGELREMLSRQFKTKPIDSQTIGFDWLAGAIPFGCYAEINPQLKGFLFRAILTLPIEPERRPAVAEYLHRVNYPTPIGGWAIDLDSGDVRWKSGCYFGEEELTDELMFEAMNSSFALIRMHVLGLVKVATGESLQAAMAVLGDDPGEGEIVSDE